MKTNNSLSSNWNHKVITRAVCLALLSGTVFAQNTPSAETKSPPPLPLHAELARDAGRASKAENWGGALEKATNCIQRFERRATAIQDAYRSTNAPVIPANRVLDPVIRKEILSRGPLNDVAACYIYVGRARLAQYAQEPNKNAAAAQELLKRAKEAFEKARTFTYAYVYDPTNPSGFWRPAEKASEALSAEPLVSFQE